MRREGLSESDIEDDYYEDGDRYNRYTEDEDNEPLRSRKQRRSGMFGVPDKSDTTIYKPAILKHRGSSSSEINDTSNETIQLDLSNHENDKDREELRIRDTQSHSQFVHDVISDYQRGNGDNRRGESMDRRRHSVTPSKQT